MPLDTSIPLQVQVPQYGNFAATAAEQQMNALRAQVLQQQMQQNAMSMQNTMEDRQRAEANRRAAAAQAAAAQRRQQEYMGILSGFGATPAAVGQRGVSYSGTGMSTDPYAPIQNELLRRGFVSQAEELAKLQKEQLAGEESKAKIPGFQAESSEKQTKAEVAKLDAAVTRYIPAVRGVSTSDDAMRLTDMLYDDPTLGPLLTRVAPREQARAQAAQEFSADPVAFMRRHLLTGKELYDATVQATAPMEYTVQKTSEGLVRVPKTGIGDAIPVMVNGKRATPADERTIGYEPASEAVLKKSGESLVEEEKALRNAPLDIDNLEKAKALIPQAKTFMGPGGELKMDVVSFFNNTFGTQISTEGIRTAQDLEARLFKGVMDNLKKMDSQPTQQQQEALRKALGQLKNDPNALNDIITTMQDAIRARVDLHNSRVQQAKERGVQGAYNLDIKLAPKSSASAADSLSVTTPNGKVYSFPTPEAAAQFKKAAGIP
jgi:hypothetical protein